MCLYIRYQFGCDDCQLGPLDKHCSQIKCQQSEKPCPGKENAEDCCSEKATCELMGFTRIQRREGACRTCRKVVVKDERRIRKEIEIRYQAIDTVEESLLRHRRRTIRRQRELTNYDGIWIAQQEGRIRRYEEAILFLADGAKGKDEYLSVFLRHVEQRQVDREVGILEAQRDVLARKRLECWDNMATLLDL